jgi:hypothetical protein
MVVVSLAVGLLFEGISCERRTRRKVLEADEDGCLELWRGLRMTNDEGEPKPKPKEERGGGAFYGSEA